MFKSLKHTLTTGALAGALVVMSAAVSHAQPNNWKSWGSFTLTSGTTSHITADASNNIYLGGYGQCIGMDYSIGSQTDAAVTVFPANGKTLPPVASQLLISKRIRTNEGWGVPKDSATQQGTNGYLGLSKDPVTGKVFLSMDGNPGSPAFTVKMDATGTTDSTWNNGNPSVYEITTGSTPRLQGNAVSLDGRLFLPELFCATNPKIYVFSADGLTSQVININGVTNHIRDIAVKNNSTIDMDSVTLFVLANDYKSIYKIEVDLGDLTPIYTSTKLTADLATGGSGGIYYNAEDDTLIHANGVESKIYVYDASTGNLKQTMTGMTSQNDAVVIKAGTDDETMYSVASNRVVFASKREGIVQVNQGTAPVAAQWSVDGGTTWKNFGDTASVFAGENTAITYKPVATYVTPAPGNVTPLRSGTTAVTAPAYTPIAADVTVTIEPASVRPTAGWMLVEGAPNPTAPVRWNASGTTETAVPGGQYSVTFKGVTGYDTPADMLVDVNSTAPISVTGTYILSKGELVVNITGPAEARWSVDDFATSYTTGSAVPLTPGSYTVKFSAVPEWVAPASQPVTLVAKTTAVVNVAYIKETGSVSVSLDPADAVAEGAQWSVDGGLTWKNSGETVTAMQVGSCQVVFKNLNAQRWATPNPQTLTVPAGGTVTATGTYARYAGMTELFEF